MNTTNIITPFMAQVLRRMAWRHGLPWLARGLAAGITAAAVILLVARPLSWSGASWWALALGFILTFAGVAMALLTRPPDGAALRTADGLLGLRDRLTTAWEYGDRDAPILQLQRGDLSARVERLDLRRGLPLRPGRRHAIAPAVGTALLVLAMLRPAGQPHVVAARPLAHNRIAHAARRIDATHRAIGLPHATLAALSRLDRLRQAQMTRVLARLRHELAAARTPAQALKALSRAQDALNRLGNPRAATERAALAALASALEHGATTGRSAVAGALRQGNPAAIKAALHRLSGSLAHASPAARATLARALQAAAHAASADQSLSSALQNASTSLAQDDVSGAQAALESAGREASGDAARAAQQAALDHANGALNDARNDVSGLNSDVPSTGSSGRGSSGQSGKSGAGNTGTGGTGQGSGTKGQARAGTGNGAAGKGQGNGTGNGKGQGAGQGAGTGSGNGSGQGAGTGSGQGSGSGSGTGTGSGSGKGQGGQGQGGGTGSGGNPNGGNNGGGDRVWIPGTQGQGPSQSTSGPKGAPTGGALRPWRSVLPSYERSARSSLENGSVPPGQRALVRQYFDQLNQ